MPIFHPPSPGAPRRAFPRASFSAQRNPQRGPGRLTDSAARTDLVLLIRRTVRPRGYASGFDSPAALLDDRFDKPAYDGERADSMRSSASNKSACRNR